MHGIIVDWHVGGGIATVVFLCDETASIYLSSGGGFLGAGGQPAVVAAGKDVLAAAVRDRKQFAPTPEAILPDANQIRFTLLTDAGLLTVLENTSAFESGASPLADLGNKVQSLIAEIRRASER